jgi:hypothetical protein
MNIEPKFWQAQLAEFGERNNLRPTRLEVLGSAKEIESDFWLEDGLLLTGIELDPDGDHGPKVEIMLEAPAEIPQNHMTHTVDGVRRIEMHITSGVDEELEIEDSEGTMTILRFESEVLTKI